MKKAIIILLMSALLAGCGTSREGEIDSRPAEGVSRFETVERGLSWFIVADRQTGVMYAVSRGIYNTGTLTLLVDKDGKPLIWREVKRDPDN